MLKHSERGHRNRVEETDLNLLGTGTQDVTERLLERVKRVVSTDEGGVMIVHVGVEDVPSLNAMSLDLQSENRP